LKDDIPIENTDLCSILSNLLDNAIEASCKLNENRYINIEMITFKNQFNIKIVNATNGEYKLENGKLKTTKSGDLHGIGIGHVKSIVESYGGILNVNPESKSFITHISIPLAQKSTN
jgi:sensor histidine kinase regulating citrate/malate metabolism